MSVTPVSAQFSTYCEGMFGVTSAAYLCLSIGCGFQLVRMRVYRNSLNPQFFFFLCVLLGSLLRVISCALDYVELQQALIGLPTTDGRIGFFISHLSAYAFVLANISCIYIWALTYYLSRTSHVSELLRTQRIFRIGIIVIAVLLTCAFAVVDVYLSFGVVPGITSDQINIIQVTWFAVLAGLVSAFAVFYGILMAQTMSRYPGASHAKQHAVFKIGVLMAVMTISLPARAAFLVWEVVSDFIILANIYLRNHVTVAEHLFLELTPIAAMTLLLRHVADLRTKRGGLSIQDIDKHTDSGVAMEELAHNILDRKI